MTLDELQQEAYSNAVQKGFADKEVPIPEMIALIHSEASEALESYRNGEPISWRADVYEDNPEGKPLGLASEFADILIRIGHYATLLKIDLDYEVRRKLDYNKGRAYRHGGKLI